MVWPERVSAKVRERERGLVKSFGPYTYMHTPRALYKKDLIMAAPGSKPIFPKGAY